MKDVGRSSWGECVTQVCCSHLFSPMVDGGVCLGEQLHCQTRGHLECNLPGKMFNIDVLSDL